MTSLRTLASRFQSFLSARAFSSSSRRLQTMADSGVIVTVEQGKLRGRTATSPAGTRYFTVQGVPYAKPPLGPLRFKAPQPHGPWTGIREALSEGNVCSQIDPITNEYIGEEDCLFLNVFTPQIPAGEGSVHANRAVMVFIHGGGFAVGSGDSNVYGPDYLVDQDVVYVSFNYRLGPFGFLSTEDGEIPGNAGMKDQVAALRWVKQNIARFGGNPDNVTIFGESAGGASVHYHMLSPMSKGLFHRAISQSGSALNIWAFSDVPRSRTVRLARALGCQSVASTDVLAFLRGVPAKTLADNSMLAMTDEEKRRAGLLNLPFVPMSERLVTSGEEKFLTTDPIDIIQSGRFNMVPYITGFNSNEGLLALKDVMGKPNVLQKIDSDFERLLPQDMLPKIDTAQSREAALKLKTFFFGEKALSEDTLQNYADLKSDTLFVYTINKTVQLQAALSSAPLYYYQFTFDGELGIFKKFVLNEDFPGVSHADELGYLFHISLIPMEMEDNSPEVRVRSVMVKMWTNFAKTGNPSADVTWEPVSLNKKCYLRIDEIPEMMLDVEKERMEFWDKLYNTYNTNGKMKLKSNL